MHFFGTDLVLCLTVQHSDDDDEHGDRAHDSDNNDAGSGDVSGDVENEARNHDAAPRLENEAQNHDAASRLARSSCMAGACTPATPRPERETQVTNVPRGRSSSASLARPSLPAVLGNAILQQAGSTAGLPKRRTSSRSTASSSRASQAHSETNELTSHLAEAIDRRRSFIRQDDGDDSSDDEPEDPGGCGDPSARPSAPTEVVAITPASHGPREETESEKRKRLAVEEAASEAYLAPIRRDRAMRDRKNKDKRIKKQAETAALRVSRRRSDRISRKSYEPLASSADLAASEAPNQEQPSMSPASPNQEPASPNQEQPSMSSSSPPYRDYVDPSPPYRPFEPDGASTDRSARPSAPTESVDASPDVEPGTGAAPETVTPALSTEMPAAPPSGVSPADSESATIASLANDTAEVHEAGTRVDGEPSPVASLAHDTSEVLRLHFVWLFDLTHRERFKYWFEVVEQPRETYVAVTLTAGSECGRHVNAVNKLTELLTRKEEMELELKDEVQRSIMGENHWSGGRFTLLFNKTLLSKKDQSVPTVDELLKCGTLVGVIAATVDDNVHTYQYMILHPTHRERELEQFMFLHHVKANQLFGQALRFGNLFYEEMATDMIDLAKNRDNLSRDKCARYLKSLYDTPIEIEVDTRLQIYWEKDDLTHEGIVKGYSNGKVTVYYPGEERAEWQVVEHNFNQDQCYVTNIIEPAEHRVVEVKRTIHAFQVRYEAFGKRSSFYQLKDSNPLRANWLETTGHDIYDMEIDQQFPRTLGARSMMAVPPHCVCESLARAFDYLGNKCAANNIRGDAAESLKQKKRIEFVAGRANKYYGCDAVKTREKIDVLTYRPEHPALVQVSRGHAVTLLKNLIFDYAEDEPLQNNRENLEMCIGSKFDEFPVTAYMFVPKPKKRSMATDLPPAKRPGSSDPA
jgi:hypothetical protein